MMQFHATTIVLVKRSADDICIGGDGQVTMGEHAIMKNNAKKVRKIYKNSVITGFAGSVSDAFSLTEKFEKKLEEHGGNLKRAAVALAQTWRSDGGARNLEAMMLAADKESVLLISGSIGVFHRNSKNHRNLINIYLSLQHSFCGVKRCLICIVHVLSPFHMLLYIVS